MNWFQARAARKDARRILDERKRYYDHLDNWDWMWSADFPNAFHEELRFKVPENYNRCVTQPVIRRRDKDFPHGNPYKYPERYKEN